MTSVQIIPAKQPLRGRASPPGSKSLTNRALLLAALARGSSRLSGALKSDDTDRMVQSLIAMGVAVDEPDSTTFQVSGDGQLKSPSQPLFMGNAGTATRFLTAAAALVDGPVVIDGDVHMRRRPIGPLVEALQSLGVTVSTATGCPPVIVQGQGGLNAGRVQIDGQLSSQYVSALLMVAACGRGAIEVALKGETFGARGYVDLTVAAMERFGARVERPTRNVWRVAPTGYRAEDILIEPDASAATYLWAAERLTQGSIDLGISASAFTQPDAAAHALIAQFPALPSVIEGSQIQDAVPTLAVMAAFNQTPVRFTGIANLRVKECDRVRALSTELNRIRPGLAAEDGDDLLVYGDPALTGQAPSTRIQTYSDHRIAMSFALAGLRLAGLTILDPECTAKTWPGYWTTLSNLGVGLSFSAV